MDRLSSEELEVPSEEYEEEIVQEDEEDYEEDVEEEEILDFGGEDESGVFSDTQDHYEGPGDEEEKEDRIDMGPEYRIFEYADIAKKSRFGAPTEDWQRMPDTVITGNDKIARLHRAQTRMGQSLDETFRKELRKKITSLNISEALGQMVNSEVSKLPYYQFKNPAALLYGAKLAFDSDADELTFHRVSGEAKAANVPPVDLLRYWRLWDMSLKRSRKK